MIDAASRKIEVITPPEVAALPTAPSPPPDTAVD
jgi:hypothetical protein